PTLFRSRLLATSDAQIDGTTLTSSAIDFEAAGIDEGHVVQIAVNSVAAEVVQRVNASTLEVSLPRTAKSDSKIPPGDGDNPAIVVLTFGRLMDQAQEWALAALGLDPDHPTHPLDAAAI